MKKKEKSMVPTGDSAPIVTGVPMPDNSPQGLLAIAVARGASVDEIGKLIDLQIKMKAEMAREAFNEAMTAFQGECPVIEKKKEVRDDGRLLYKYAPLDSIIEQVKSVLNKHGLSYMIKVEFQPDKVKAICIAKHKLGHSEVSDFEIPFGNKTKMMSGSQHAAAAATFAKRYAFCNAFGIMTGDEDTDGADIGEKQFKKAIIKEAEDRISKTANLQELEKVWSALPAAAKVELKDLKDNMKKLHMENLEELEGKKLDSAPVEPVGTTTVVQPMASPEKQKEFLDTEGVDSLPV